MKMKISMTLSENRYAVRLQARRVGTLHQRGDYTWFRFEEDYLNDPHRAILGLTFEDDPRGRQASALRLPAWFSNLLPEGPLRAWIAEDRGVSADREMELLAQVGHDLPGAVTVIADDGDDSDEIPQPPEAPQISAPAGSDRLDWKFSLAGVGLKFSMVKHGERLSLPASGLGGDWIVKLPDQLYDDVPLNEFAMMTLARMSGIEVPDIQLVHRDHLMGLPEDIWPRGEQYAYAVRRFDRPAPGALVHIEDFAQVRNVLPHGQGKYQGNFETVAALAYRGQDVASLREVVRRLTFNILISNGDAHLKNWSLIYLDPRNPRLSPVYDLVSTAVYAGPGHQEDLGLKLGGSRRFDRVSLATFERLEQRVVGETVGLVDEVGETIDRVRAALPAASELLAPNPAVLSAVHESVEIRSKSLSRR